MLLNIQTEFAENLTDVLLGEEAVVPSYLKIYKNNISASLLSTLQHIYPLCVKLLGEDFFKQCAYQYIRFYPSRSSNLHDYGEYFTAFLNEHELTCEMAYLAEIASFEWQCHILQFAADSTALELSKLEQISRDKMPFMHFTLNPAIALKHFQYPLLRIIDLCKQVEPSTLHIEPEDLYLLMMNNDHHISFIPQSFADFTFLSKLQEGCHLGEALEFALEIDSQFSLEEKLPIWIQNKILVDCFL